LPAFLLCWRINLLDLVDVDDGGAGCGVGIFLTDDVARFVVYLLAMGMDLCSPRGFLFLVGDYVAGGRSPSRLPSLPGSGSASFPSSCLALPGLEGSAWFSPTSGSLIFVQCFKSVLVGVPGRWLLRLHQELRSSSGGEEAPGFGSARASRSGGMIESSPPPPLQRAKSTSPPGKGLQALELPHAPSPGTPSESISMNGPSPCRKERGRKDPPSPAGRPATGARVHRRRPFVFIETHFFPL